MLRQIGAVSRAANAVKARSFHTTAAAAVGPQRKSFVRKKVTRKENHKGPGSVRNFQEEILEGNYKKTASDANVIEKLPVFDLSKAGQVTQYGDDVRSRMYRAGSFKPQQFHELYSRPVTLVRQAETVQVADLYNKSLDGYQRLLLTGPTGVGKSTLLAHLHSFVLSDPEAVLIPVSNAESLVDGSSDFKYNEKTGLYEQKMAARNLLKKIISINKPVLKSIQLSKPFPEAKSAKVETLLDLAIQGQKARLNATQALVFLLEQLGEQTAHPVYLTIDNFSAFVQHTLTAYRDANNVQIYFGDLAIAKTLVDYLSGESVFAKGATVAATRGIDRHTKNNTIRVGLGLEEPNVYKKLSDYDPKLAQSLRSNNLTNLEVSKLGVDEIEALLEHMFNCDVIHNEYQMSAEVEQLGERDYLRKLAQRKYISSGNGNARLFLESCVLAYV